MCGIVGYCGHNHLDHPQQILQKMLTSIKHRGPDESGIYLSNHIGLGSVRLSIIGLSNGVMPIADAYKENWIVFNGEIYNYIELKKELQALGYNFTTNTDTEVVVNLYHAFGDEFLQKLNGQFAIAIWNRKHKSLFLARDRVGIRPLFYTEINNNIVFGSEIKSFLHYPHFKSKLSTKRLVDYFTFWSNHPSHTVFEGVYEVPPGHFYKFKNGTLSKHQYWRLPMVPPSSYKYQKKDIKMAKQDFETLLKDSIKLRLRADVPIAAYLSGGLDSTVTTSLIKSIDSNLLNTFSISFNDKEFDESDYQNIASQYFNTKHTTVTCTQNDIANNFAQSIWNIETPLLRTSPVPMNLLAKEVRRSGIKVVITGEGADELLGGYNIYKENKIRRFWAKNPSSKYRPLLLNQLYPYLKKLGRNNTALKMFFGYRLEDVDHPYYSHLLRWHNTSRLKNYFSEELKESLENYNSIDQLEESMPSGFNELDDLTKAQMLEINWFMSGYLLSSQGDRMAMANSVEGRYPFLDHRVIEFCMQLHPDLKINILNEKYLLKEVFRGQIPDQIINRSKQAYRAPINSAFMSEEFLPQLKETLSQNNIKKANIFNAEYVEKLISKFIENKKISEIDNMALSAILSTQILYKQFVERKHHSLVGNTLILLDKIIIDD